MKAIDTVSELEGMAGILGSTAKTAWFEFTENNLK